MNQELNIAKSKAINAARLKKMEERNKCLDEIKDMMVDKLKDEMTGNRDRYFQTCKNLILQSMIKLIEPTLHIMCREDDKDELEGMLGDIQDEYKAFMSEKTERDEYETTLTIIEDKFIP